MASNISPFGHTADGTPVQRIELTGRNLRAAILTYGATVQDLRWSGTAHPLVLGWEDLNGYLTSDTYFGAIVGRFANRIAHGRYWIDDQEFQTQHNFLDRHTLHGGIQGSSHQVWHIEKVNTQSVELSLEMPDGHMGFSGHLTVRTKYEIVQDRTLQVTICATCTSPSLCSFAPHSYFNLDGGPDITNHSLQINAETYLQTDGDLIPTGTQLPVKTGKCDFRAARPIGKQELDHNFCLASARCDLRPVASLQSSRSGLRMTVHTTEPGLQIYTAAQLDTSCRDGLEGRRYGNFAGLAIEPQLWPDAPNHPGFPNAALYPGQISKQVTRFEFAQD